MRTRWARLLDIAALRGDRLPFDGGFRSALKVYAVRLIMLVVFAVALALTIVGLLTAA